MTDPHPGKAVLSPRSPTLPVSATLNQVLPSPENEVARQRRAEGRKGTRTKREQNG